MRHTCELKTSTGELCGKPAVDFVQTDGEEGYATRTIWLCAKHFDGWTRLKAIFDRLAKERKIR